MRYLPIFLALLLMAGAASAQWYPSVVPVVQTLDAAESTDDDQIFNATGGKLNTTTKLIITSTGAYSGYFIAQPDVARNIIGTVNASTNLSVKITGTDINGAAITENLTWAAATGVKASTKAFDTVTRVDATLTAGESAKTLKLGTGDLLGLRQRFPALTVVLGTGVNGALEGTAPAMTYNSTVVSLNTINTSSAPGGYVTKVVLLSF